MGTDQDMATQQGSAPRGAAAVTTPLHRKVKAGQAERQARGMSLLKALRLTLAKVGDDLFDLPIAVIAARSERCTVDAVQDTFAGAGLLMLLDGSGGTRGAAAFDPALVGALIQQQTMARVLPATDAAARPMTPTDAAIAAPLLDALLSRAALLPEDAEEQALIAGFAFGARVEDARVLCMALDGPEHRLIELTVDIAGGLRQGRILLCLPHPAKPLTAAPAAPGDGASDRTTPEEEGAFAATLLTLQANLRVSLAQIRIPLHRIDQLCIGDCLDLGRASFSDVRLETLQGRPVGGGVLGQLEGVRAVQVQPTRTSALRLRRRAGDRADLNLPDVTDAAVAPTAFNPASASMAERPMATDDYADLPDLSDLPEVNTG